MATPTTLRSCVVHFIVPSQCYFYVSIHQTVIPLWLELHQVLCHLCLYPVHSSTERVMTSPIWDKSALYRHEIFRDYSSSVRRKFKNRLKRKLRAKIYRDISDPFRRFHVPYSRTIFPQSGVENCSRHEYLLLKSTRKWSREAIRRVSLLKKLVQKHNVAQNCICCLCHGIGTRPEQWDGLSGKDAREKEHFFARSADRNWKLAQRKRRFRLFSAKEALESIASGIISPLLWNLEWNQFVIFMKWRYLKLSRAVWTFKSTSLHVTKCFFYLC